MKAIISLRINGEDAQIEGAMPLSAIPLVKGQPQHGFIMVDRHGVNCATWIEGQASVVFTDGLVLSMLAQDVNSRAVS